MTVDERADSKPRTLLADRQLPPASATEVHTSVSKQAIGTRVPVLYSDNARNSRVETGFARALFERLQEHHIQHQIIAQLAPEQVSLNAPQRAGQPLQQSVLNQRKGKSARSGAFTWAVTDGRPEGVTHFQGLEALHSGLDLVRIDFARTSH
jgi:hypothetical protein